MKEIYTKFVSTQTKEHENLINILNSYKKNKFLASIPKAQEKAFNYIKLFFKTKTGPFIIDSFVGSGMSTKILATMYPNHKILGVERCLSLLKQEKIEGPNFLILRADVYYLWILLANEGFLFEKHFIFYPNPYPKKTQIKKRFYAHPTFINAIQISKTFEIRCNWEIFAKEALLALNFFGFTSNLEIFKPDKPVSLFEKKYLDVNCPIYKIASN